MVAYKEHFDSLFMNGKPIGWNVFRILTNINLINIFIPNLALRGMPSRLTFDFKVTLKSI